MSSNYITSLLFHLDMAASSTPSDFQLSLPTSALSDGSTADHDSGVGLADLQLSKDRRRTIDLVNRLNNTGSISLLPLSPSTLTPIEKRRKGH
jgi:hypothetical protein